MTSAERRPQRLDDWYKLTNGIYADRNYYRSADSLFSHLVEVIGGLSSVASSKTRPEGWNTTFLAKSFGWWFALCGKIGVRSVEDLIWAKFPSVCPYCQLEAHRAAACRQSRETSHEPDWDRLRQLGQTHRRPETVDEWRTMFQRVFERSDNTSQQQNFARLTEELGELAEAVRTLPITRSYFLSEAADVFAWLMGVANQMAADAELGRNTNLGDWSTADALALSLWEEYPGRCRHCKSPSCKCAPLISESRGRIAHMGPKYLNEAGLFTTGESLDFFRLGDEWLTLHDQQIEVTTGFLDELRVIGSRMMAQASSLALGDRTVVVELERIGESLSEVTAQQQDLQAIIEDADRTIARMPMGVREAIGSFLISLSAGAWLQVAVTYGPKLFH